MSGTGDYNGHVWDELKRCISFFWGSQSSAIYEFVHRATINMQPYVCKVAPMRRRINQLSHFVPCLSRIGKDKVENAKKAGSTLRARPAHWRPAAPTCSSEVSFFRLSGSAEMRGGGRKREVKVGGCETPVASQWHPNGTPVKHPIDFFDTDIKKHITERKQSIFECLVKSPLECHLNAT